LHFTKLKLPTILLNSIIIWIWVVLYKSDIIIFEIFCLLFVKYRTTVKYAVRQCIICVQDWLRMIYNMFKQYTYNTSIFYNICYFDTQKTNYTIINKGYLYTCVRLMLGPIVIIGNIKINTTFKYCKPLCILLHTVCLPVN